MTRFISVWFWLQSLIVCAFASIIVNIGAELGGAVLFIAIVTLCVSTCGILNMIIIQNNVLVFLTFLTFSICVGLFSTALFILGNGNKVFVFIVFFLIIYDIYLSLRVNRY